MDVLKIGAVILIAVILLSCLPGIEKSVTSVIYISVSVIVLLYIIVNISDSVNSIKLVMERFIYNDFSIIFKAMGISLVTQFVSDIATDTGNKALANQMIFVGKAGITIISLPILIQVLELIGKFAE